MENPKLTSFSNMGNKTTAKPTRPAAEVIRNTPFQIVASVQAGQIARNVGTSALTGRTVKAGSILSVGRVIK